MVNFRPTITDHFSSDVDSMSNASASQGDFRMEASKVAGRMKIDDGVDND